MMRSRRTPSSRCSWARRLLRGRTSSSPRPGRSATLTSDVATTRRGGLRGWEFEPHHCFACGELNESGLRLELHADSQGCWTELTLEPRFQGWDSVAHGGIVATLLDEVMAWSVIGRDTW